MSQTNFVFINSSDPLMPSQVINDAQPFIKLPFPPMIDPRDLITLNPDGREPSKAPNAFIIYRKLFIKTARNEGYSLPMSIISSMVSKSWEKESEIVKKEYKRIAREAFLYRSEIYPKPKREGKRKQWNIVSFDQSNNNNKFRNVKSQKSVDMTLQLPAQNLSPSTSESELNSPEPADNSPILNMDLFADWKNYLYASPNLSIYSDNENCSLESNEVYNFNIEIDSPLQTFYNLDSPIQIEEQQFHDSAVNVKDVTLPLFFDNQIGLGISNPEYLTNIGGIPSNDFYDDQLTSLNFLDFLSIPTDFNNIISPYGE
ncbi:14002_t:CDS:1, partial [Acaulospora colombiana]